MKKILAFATVGLSLLLSNTLQAQNDKPAPKSPPATVTQKIKSGATITINYSQPSLRGRTIGKDVEPMADKVWRMGANEATTFETDMDVTIEGEKLPAGKYSIFGIMSDDGFRIIFNKNWKIWGTQYDKNKEGDVLNVKVESETNKKSQEKLTYSIDKGGEVKMVWGTLEVEFEVK